MENKISTQKQGSNQVHIGSWRRYSPSEIMLLLASANYTEIHFTNGRKMLVATTLKQLEKRFSVSGDFFRTHKSFLINLNHIKTYDRFLSDEFVEMQNNYKVAVSRRRKTAFEKRINELNT